ncbi:helix-turn-helix domain-containing protein, partial [Synechococcus sp. CS-1325]
ATLRVASESDANDRDTNERGDSESDDSENDDTPGLLAIDDADDFVDDDADEGLEEDTDTSLEDRDREANIFVTVAVGAALEDRPATTCQPLEVALLPACLYMLVDKTVELQARPLSDFPELGRLPDGEQQRQALVVFANPRQAKRHCGRTQRVIKLPDSQVIHRTASYLLGQGITRLVLEGALYSLPGS